MITNASIFKAYDIRGIYSQDLDDETAYRLGRAYARMRHRETGKDQLEIIVARDMRLSSPSLHDSLIKGLRAEGVNVTDAGMLSTPGFYFAVGRFAYDGGIIVTASHNPMEWNGFKVVREKALPVSGDNGLFDLRDEVINGDFSDEKVLGSLSTRDDLVDAHLAHDLTFSDLSKIRPLKIAVDTANAMGAQYLDKLFSALPNEVVKINNELDGTFPAHEADPLKEENLAQLQELVKNSGADLGIATDGDGDRIFFVDELGRTIDQSIVRGLLARIFIREKGEKKVCYDIRPGRITVDMILEAGGTPIVTKVGHSLIKAQTIAEGAYFAGESSGHFFLNQDIGCFEVPVIVALKLLEEFSLSNRPISEQLKSYQKYAHSGEINSVVSDKDKVLRELEAKYPDAKISKLDGITIEMPDFWFNVRGSNTEPKLRLNLEAISQDIMEEKRDEVLSIIRS